MQPYISINNRNIGPLQPTYIIAEISANHNQNFDCAVNTIHAAKAAGADAVKLQTYTPDTMTINCDTDYFRIKGTIWEGKNLYQLYSEAYMPWEWQPKLKKVAESIGLDLFSTPFDISAVDYLEEIEMPAYKIASFEVVDIPLLRRIAATAKPIIMSTGMATLAEIDEAVKIIRNSGGQALALLKCTSAYPTPVHEVNLRTIQHLSDTFDVPAGLSDHTLGIEVSIAAVALGACIIERHFTISRSDPGPDSSFSLEPDEFKSMVDAIRVVEKAIGDINYGITTTQAASRVFRRSLFAVKDIAAGEKLTSDNVKSIRPAHGMHTRYLDDILERRAKRAIKRGTPLTWELLS